QNKTTSGCGQVREFEFDNRGFLLSEQLPEKGDTGHGVVTYSCYDAKGHARYRDDGSSTRRLGFEHDFAERLVEVRTPTEAGCGTATTAGTVGKSFTYATANSGGQANKGRLTQATRRNVPGAPYPGAGVVEVTDSYTYLGRQGR